MALLTFTPNGIYCPKGKFYIDPWRKVERAIITHAHSDHARKGMGSYLSHSHTAPILKLRLGKNIHVQTVAYGEEIDIYGVKVALFPAGHIIGSAQVSVSYKDEVWVVSGDYKLEKDPISTPFEIIPCHNFITESTFGLPIYAWQAQETVLEEINAWWRQNASLGITSVIQAYSLGKAQRLLESLDRSIGPILVSDSIAEVNQAFRAVGVPLHMNYRLNDLYSAQFGRKERESSLVIGASFGSQAWWQEEFSQYAVASVSGWMRLGKMAKQRSVDIGFVLSDHADWKGLNEAVKATGASQVYVTHGYSEEYAKWLHEHVGISAKVVETAFEHGGS